MDQNRVKRPVSLSHDGTPAGSERETATRTVRSAGAEVTSWNEVRPGGTSICLMRIVPNAPERVAPLAEALGGAGRPAGIIEVTHEPGAVVASFDVAQSSIELVLAIAEAETVQRPKLALPPDDAHLTAICAALLGEPDLDTYRLIETYIEPMLFVSP